MSRLREVDRARMLNGADHARSGTVQLAGRAGTGIAARFDKLGPFSPRLVHSVHIRGN